MKPGQRVLRVAASVIASATCLAAALPTAASASNSVADQPIGPGHGSPVLALPTPTPVVIQRQPPPKTDPKSAAIPYIAYPQHVALTGDPNVCADHGGVLAGVLCGTMLQQGGVALVWDWQSPERIIDPAHLDRQYTIIKDIDGFHAYEQDASFAHKLVSTTSLGGGSTVTMFMPPDLPAGAPAQRCFVVRGYKGQVESDDSAALCTASGQLPAPVTAPLAPLALRTIRHAHAHELPIDLQTCAAFSSGLVVGYLHCNDGSVQAQEVSRVLVKFDTSGLGPITKAVLTFHRDVTYLMGTDPYDNNVASAAPADEPLHGRADASCASMLLQPTVDWSGWDDSDPQAAPPVTDLPTQDLQTVSQFGADFALDVTDLARNWRLYPSSNNGLALRGTDEDTGQEDNNACFSTYSGFALQVTQLPLSLPGGPLIDPGTVGQPADH